MPNTITAFNTFTAGNIIVSEEHDENWDNVRGTRIPILDTGVGASDGVHHLGTEDHSWLNSYKKGYDYYLPTGATAITTAGVWRRGIDPSTGNFVLDKYSTTAWVNKRESF